MKSLYNNLMALTDSNDAFFFKDVYKDDDTLYRIFNYRLASYTDFLLPSAMECRGIMFEIDNNYDYVSIKCRPMQKFFNLNENPLTMNLDLSSVNLIMDKGDGSLISTYHHDGEVYLKSKGSLSSDQANDASEWFNAPEQEDLKMFVEDLEAEYTVNFEWCSPENRIVLPYDKPHLKLLNIRHNHTGDYLEIYGEPASYMNTLNKYRIEGPIYSDPVEFLKTVSDMKGIEGYVFRMGNGMFVKIKTLAYMALHHSKDSINSPRRLFEAVLEESSDDLRSMFYDDPLAIALIEEMESFTENLVNSVVHDVEILYNTYKDLDRKEFAITVGNEIDKKYFGLAMNLYLNKPNNYKDFFKRNWKKFGIKEDMEITND